MRLTAAISLLLLLVVGGTRVWGQCAPGDVLWVSDAVNADVGTGVGGGGTGARCATSTVAGAAYNSVASPFGLQAAFDCSCPGSSIRILAGANDYGSASASWNNRIAADKEIQITVNGAFTNPIRIEGWVDGGTQCTLLHQTGCPIVMDFTGGSSSGIRSNVGGGAGPLAYTVSFLRITGAASSCWIFNNIRASVLVGLEGDNCGITGINVGNTTFPVDSLFLYAHDNGGDGLVGAGNSGIGSKFLESHDNGANGYNSTSQILLWRGLLYDNVMGGLSSSASNADNLMWVTSVRSTNAVGDGWTGSSASLFAAGGWGLLAQDNADWGMDDYTTPGTFSAGIVQLMTTFYCLAVAGNGSGAIRNPTSPQVAQIRDAPNTTDIATFAGPSDFSVSGIPACSFSWDGNDTTMSFCPGASASCQGGGLFIQSVR